MFEFVIAVLAVLIGLAIVSKMRKDKAEKASHVKAQAPAKPVQENKPAVKPVEPKKEPVAEIKPEVEIEAEVVAAEAVAVAAAPTGVATAAVNRDDHLPEDSTLRRHYLTQLRATIAALNPTRPSDSTLSRHYDAMLNAELELCATEPAAIERLQRRYDDHKKPNALATVTAEPAAKAEIAQEQPTLPEDSMLKRHAITHLNSLVG